MEFIIESTADLLFPSRSAAAKRERETEREKERDRERKREREGGTERESAHAREKNTADQHLNAGKTSEDLPYTSPRRSCSTR